MLEVTHLKVASFDLDHLDLYWEISPVLGPRRDEDAHPIFDYDFYILRSGDSPMGPYDQIAGPFRDQYIFRDVQVSLLHKWRTYYYKIKVVHRPTGESKEFGPAASGENPPDLVAAAIIHEEDILFREFIGRRCWLFIARTFGPRCTCWDSTLQRRTRSGHLICYDSGFLGGYMAPIEVFVQIDPAGKHPSATPVGELQPNDCSARMIYFPLVSPRDILVEAENTRWRVVSLTTTQRLRATVRQELVLHAIPKGDIEYELPLNVETQKFLNPAAPRNFTNPHNVEKDGDYSDIITFFDRPGPHGSIR